LGNGGKISAKTNTDTCSVSLNIIYTQVRCYHYFHGLHLQVDKIREGEMGETCNTHRSDENAYKILVRKPERRR
jgi:hypothetical protein